MPDCVILQHELAGKRGIAVERHRSRPIELLVAESPNSGGGRRAVAVKQVQRRRLRHSVVLLSVFGIDLVNGIPGYARYRLAAR
jgi:hypothetical protein